MEMLVVVLIVGVLASMGVSQYYKAVEEAKADHASSMTSMIGAAVRMYMVDHPSQAIVPGQLTSACNSQCCYDNSLNCPGSAGSPGITTASQADPCQIIACGYLPYQDFNCLPYSYFISNGGTPPIGAPKPGYAYAKRQTSSSGCTDPNVTTNLATTDQPYATWAYEYVQQGCLCPFGDQTPMSGKFNSSVPSCAAVGAGCD